MDLVIGLTACSAPAIERRQLQADPLPGGVSVLVERAARWRRRLAPTCGHSASLPISHYDARSSIYGTVLGDTGASPARHGLLAWENQITASAVALDGDLAGDPHHSTNGRYGAIATSAAKRLRVVDGRHGNDQPRHSGLGDARWDGLYRQSKERQLTTHKQKCEALAANTAPLTQTQPISPATGTTTLSCPARAIVSAPLGTAAPALRSARLAIVRSSVAVRSPPA